MGDPAGEDAQRLQLLPLEHLLFQLLPLPYVPQKEQESLLLFSLASKGDKGQGDENLLPREVSEQKPHLASKVPPGEDLLPGQQPYGPLPLETADALDPLAHGRLIVPSGELLGGPVHQDDPSRPIQGQDPLVNAPEGRVHPLLLLPEGPLVPLPLVDVPKGSLYGELLPLLVPDHPGVQGEPLLLRPLSQEDLLVLDVPLGSQRFEESLRLGPLGKGDQLNRPLSQKLFRRPPQGLAHGGGEEDECPLVVDLKVDVQEVLEEGTVLPLASLELIQSLGEHLRPGLHLLLKRVVPGHQERDQEETAKDTDQDITKDDGPLNGLSQPSGVYGPQFLLGHEREALLDKGQKDIVPFPYGPVKGPLVEGRRRKPIVVLNPKLVEVVEGRRLVDDEDGDLLGQGVPNDGLVAVVLQEAVDPSLFQILYRRVPPLNGHRELLQRLRVFDPRDVPVEEDGHLNGSVGGGEGEDLLPLGSRKEGVDHVVHPALHLPHRPVPLHTPYLNGDPRLLLPEPPLVDENPLKPTVRRAENEGRVVVVHDNPQRDRLPFAERWNQSEQREEEKNGDRFHKPSCSLCQIVR